MRRKLLLILGPLCILFLVAYAALVHISNSINKGVIFYSQTVKESKEVAAFEAEYKVDSLSPFLSDSLRKYGLSHIDLSKLEYWVERDWVMKYECLLFRKISHGEGKKILITDPASLGPEDQFYPSINFAKKYKSEYDQHYSSGNKILMIEVDDIPQLLVMGIFIQTNYGEDGSYIGDIIIKKKV